MADISDNQTGTVETAAETRKTPGEFVKHWLQAIDLAGKDEDTWRKDAAETLNRYKRTKLKSFNVLFANTQTTVPALYNSEPVPDIRRRFGDEDPVGKAASDMLERLLIIQAELYNFDGTMAAAVKDRQLQGRGVSRVRVKVGEKGSKSVCDEPVIWDDFRRGPAKTWADVPWVAYRHRMTREELNNLSPTIGHKVKLDAVVDGAAKDESESKTLNDMFKRAYVWEVWDKTTLEVYWFAESYKDGPLLKQEDPYRLREFFPTPRPLYQVELTDSLIPVCEFMIWKPLADEMDSLTARIAGIVKVMKLKGLYAGQFENIISRLAGLDDGELAAAEDSARAMTDGGLKDAIWMWPVDMAIKTVQGLYEAREQAKAALYEMTGVADIQRGQTDPNETLGAQQLKAQWGSLRLQAAQKDVQRYAVDLLRMKADLSCQEMDFAEMKAMTGIDFMPDEDDAQPPQMGHNGGPPMGGQPQDPMAAQQAAMMQQQAQAMAQQQAMMQAQQMSAAVEALLKGPDIQREFRIEIETDSTIRADLSRAQQNVSGFVTGIGAFMQGVGPAVQAGFMPPEIAVKFIGVFARNFKLGREADVLVDEWVDAVEKKAKQPPPPSPEQQKMQADVAIKQQDAATKQAAAQQQAALKTQESQQKMQAEQQKHDLKIQELVAKLQAQQQELELMRQEMGMKHQERQQEAMHNEFERQSTAEFNAEKRAGELEFQQQRQAMKPTNGVAQ